MIVLGIDGALGSFSAAVHRDGATAAVVRDGNVALEEGLAAIARAMRDEGIVPQDLDRIAVGIGPGGFTGLRVAISYAKSLALAWKRPLVGVSSFDVVEDGGDATRVLAVVRGRTGVISARYRDGDASARASGPIADVFAAILPAAMTGALPVAGALSQDVRDALAERAIDVQPMSPLAEVPAAAVALLGSRRAPAESPHAVRADYGESPAAKVPKPR